MADKPTNTEEYIATLTDDQRAVVEKLRQVIRGAAPGAEDAFGYGMPALKLDGQPVFWMGAWKRHYSLYPLTAGLQREHGAELQGYEAHKGTIRFPANQPLPYDLVAKLTTTRVAELREGRG
jgi:uncharacterized protein YdhG (YjbR/CyaY superfamily)